MKIIDGGSNLTIGAQQLLNITRALIQKPKIILFNYSASAVDIHKRKLLWSILFTTLLDSTKLVSTQEVEALKKLDKVVFLKDAKIMYAGEMKGEMGGKLMRYLEGRRANPWWMPNRG